jgi:acyl dehydratase
MALNPDSVGQTTDALVHTYAWKDVVLYALGVGAQRDAELDFLYEGRGPKVLPTYAVVPTFAVPGALFNAVGGNLLGVVHGAQKIRLHKPFTPSGTLTTVGKVAGIYDLKRMAQAVFTSETRDAGGDLVCETEYLIIYRMDGGFGGTPPPKGEKVGAPDRDPDFVVEERTTEEQALLYRLNGDLNPLHADPEIGQAAGFGKPILHGLCTYGFVGRAVLQQVCGGDPGRLKALAGQFRKPVWPGETLVTEGWNDGDRVILRASTKERPGEYVFSNGHAELG